ncbi:hypothetical protein ACHAXT_002122 [Thalassiosira profunda]
MGHSRVQQQPFGVAGDGELQLDKMPSKKVLLLLFFAWPVLLCCVINLVWLHLSATAHSPRVVNAIDPGDDDFMQQRVRGAASLGNGDGASVPTYAPTTATYSPTAQNQTWAPTSGLSTVRPTSGQALGLNESGERSTAHPLAHPRVACFDSPGANTPSEKGGSCNSRGSYSEGAIRLGGDNSRKQEHPLPSIPQAKSVKAKGGKGGKGGKDESSDENEEENEVGESETCKYAQHPTCDAKAVAPSTCNEIHAIGFDRYMFSKSPRTKVKYIVMGGAKCIWKVTTWNGKEEETFILKSHKDSRFLKRQFWEANQRDALIAGGAGNAQLSQAIGSLDGSSIGSDWNHILPMYQYCGLANMVPFADGTLTEYVSNYEEEHRQRLSPSDAFNLALQAARGLHQAQLYWEGMPTFVHADMNPSQFLVFGPNTVDGDKTESRLPILQINDFNQGRFLTRNETGHVCPYKTCSKNLRGNRYHHPERFIGCVDENDRVDVYSLGSVFFFLLSGGKDPFFDSRSYFRPIKAGELPSFPGGLDLTDPAYVELRSVMSKCMSFKPEDRPSSLEVVRMLEEAEKKWGQTKTLPRVPSKEEKQQVAQN